METINKNELDESVKELQKKLRHHAKNAVQDNQLVYELTTLVESWSFDMQDSYHNILRIVSQVAEPYGAAFDLTITLVGDRPHEYKLYVYTK